LTSAAKGTARRYSWTRSTEFFSTAKKWLPQASLWTLETLMPSAFTKSMDFSNCLLWREDYSFRWERLRNYFDSRLHSLSPGAGWRPFGTQIRSTIYVERQWWGLGLASSLQSLELVQSAIKIAFEARTVCQKAVQSRHFRRGKCEIATLQIKISAIASAPSVVCRPVSWSMEL
jgi:hypothetical protein